MRRNPSRFLRLASILAAAFLVVAAVQAANNNWPQWRGPDATGAVADANPPLEWSETKNVKWKVRIPGRGSSTPIVWQDKIFIQTAVNTGKKAEQPKEKEDDAKKAASTDDVSPRDAFVAQREDTKREDTKREDTKREDTKAQRSKERRRKN